MYQYQDNELVEDSTRDDTIDTFNDETFGSENPTADWEPSFDQSASTAPLPDFFKDGPGSDFLLDEELEAEPSLDDQETPLDFDQQNAYDNEYYGNSTAKHNTNNDYFFFLDTENETMESMFNLVLNDDDDQRQPWGQSSRNDPWSMPPMQPQRQQPSYPPQQYPNQGYPPQQPQDPLAKLLANQPIPSQPFPPTNQSMKVLTAEELEARLTKGQAPPPSQQPPQMNINPAQVAALQRMGVPPHLIPQYLMSMNANPNAPPQNFQQPPNQGSYPPQNFPPQYQPAQHAQHPQQAHPQQAPQPQQPHPQQQHQAEEIDEQLFSPDQFPALSRNPPQQQPTPTRGIPIPGGNKHTNWVPKQQSPVNQFLESQSPSRGYNAASPSRGNRPNNGQYRIRWKESKEYMSAEEIDSIIRMQETQLQSVGTNSYAEDYYQQTFNLRKKQQEAVQTGQSAQVVLHKPLFESNPAVKGAPNTYLTSNLNNNTTPVSSSPMKRGPDPLEGVLGRIPSHSVRAPRPLISLKSLTVHDHNDLNNVDVSSGANKAIQSLLLTIENTYNTLLDIDDIDLLLNNPQSSSHFNVTQIRQKREELTQELFKALNVNIPQNLMPNQRMGSPNDVPGMLHFYPEDELFTSLLLVHKGKKLILRCLPVMYPNQVLAIFYSIMRNFSILVRDATREEQEYARLAKSEGNSGLAANITTAMSATQQFFAYLNNIIQQGNVSQTITAMQTILITHPIETELVILLQHRHGIMVLQNLLKRAHDLNLSMFSREPNAQVPPTSDTQLMQLAAAGFHWRETIKSLMTRLRGKFVGILDTEYGKTEKIWEFLAVLVVNITRDERRSLLLELKDKLLTIQVNPTLLAFLQLAGEGAPQ